MSKPHTYLIDLDGCIWLGGQLLPGSTEFVAHLKAERHRVCYLTNISGATGADLATRLSSLGIPTSATHVFTPLDALNGLETLKTAQPALALGSPRLSEVLMAIGIDVIGALDSAEAAKSVVLGHYGDLTLAHLDAMANVLWRGGLLVALNADTRVPSRAGRILVGVGAIAACLELAANAKALVVGKPSATFFEAALRSFGATAQTSTMIGDSIEADILGAKQVGMSTIYLGAEVEGHLADARADDLADLLNTMCRAERTHHDR